MRNYGLAVLGLSETIWNQAGQLTLPSGKVILFSGHKEDGAAHTHGVALMLSRKVAKSLVCWEAVSLRIVTAKFATNQKIKVSIIQCCAPTNDAEESKKEEFYSALQDVLDKERRKDITIIMGDFIAKIGSDNTSYQKVMEKAWFGRYE